MIVVPRPAKRKLIPGDHLAWLGALLGTLGLHSLFLTSFFTPPPAPPAADVSDQHPKCILLSPPGKAQPWENELRAWCLLADPTLLSLPSETLGFSRFRTKERLRPVQDVAPYSYTLRPQEKTIFAPPPLTDQQKPLAVALAQIWQHPLPGVQPQPAEAVLPNGIFWRTTDGAVLEHALELPPELVAAAAATGTATRPSRVEISRTRQTPHIRLLIACGNPELDKLLIKLVTEQVGRYALNAAHRHEPAAALFFPDEDSPQCFEVEWRLLQQPAPPQAL